MCSRKIAIDVFGRIRIDECLTGMIGDDSVLCEVNK